jgi:hypothetical protein
MPQNIENHTNSDFFAIISLEDTRSEIKGRFDRRVVLRKNELVSQLFKSDKITFYFAKRNLIRLNTDEEGVMIKLSLDLRKITLNLLTLLLNDSKGRPIHGLFYFPGFGLLLDLFGERVGR